PPGIVIVAARGITGGISNAGAYFGTPAGSSVPPGIAATARSVQPHIVDTYSPMVDAPVSLRKLRRGSMIRLLARNYRQYAQRSRGAARPNVLGSGAGSQHPQWSIDR